MLVVFVVMSSHAAVALERAEKSFDGDAVGVARRLDARRTRAPPTIPVLKRLGNNGADGRWRVATVVGDELVWATAYACLLAQGLERRRGLAESCRASVPAPSQTTCSLLVSPPQVRPRHWAFGGVHGCLVHQPHIQFQQPRASKSVRQLQSTTLT